MPLVETIGIGDLERRLEGIIHGDSPLGLDLSPFFRTLADVLGVVGTNADDPSENCFQVYVNSIDGKLEGYTIYGLDSNVGANTKLFIAYPERVPGDDIVTVHVVACSDVLVAGDEEEQKLLERVTSVLGGVNFDAYADIDPDDPLAEIERRIVVGKVFALFNESDSKKLEDLKKVQTAYQGFRLYQAEKGAQFDSLAAEIADGYERE